MKSDTGRARRESTRRAARKRQPSSGMAARLIIMAAVVAAVVFGVAIFFKVNTIEVQGNSLYAAEDIVAASQLELGDNLLTVNKPAAAGNIRAALPYVEQVSIGRTLPDTVVIQVKESEAAFAVTSDTNSIWLINTVGKALEKIDATRQTDYPQILGVSINNPTVGQTVTATSQSALDAVLGILAQLDGTGITEKLASINVEKEYDIILWYGEQYEIKLGGTEDLAYKIQYLTAILDQLSDYQAGTIDLSFSEENVARFQPKT